MWWYGGVEGARGMVEGARGMWAWGCVGGKGPKAGV